MNCYFAYHATKNTETFDYKGGYGFSKNAEYKYNNINVNDVVYVIQKLKNAKNFELCGKYKVICKAHKPDENPIKEYRLYFEDISKLSEPILIDEEFWGKLIPQVDSVHGWSNFKESFCPQKDNLSKILYKETTTVFDYFIGNDNSVEVIGDDFDADPKLRDTEKVQLRKARIGQGIYKSRLELVEKHCRITGVSHAKYLIASHIKPWKVSNNEERLDGNNGLLLSPHIDLLFDKGFISFQDNGELIVSQHVQEGIMDKWDILEKNYGLFNSNQKIYMAYHRKNVFEKFLRK